MARNKYKQEKYNGTYSCGHDGSVYVGGYSDEYRDEQAETQFAGLCPECKKNEKEKEYKRQAEEAQKEAYEMGLPELVGSEKQVQWANSIRQEWMDGFKEMLDEVYSDDVMYAWHEKASSFVSKEMDEKYAEFSKRIETEERHREKAKIRGEWVSFIDENISKIEDGLMRTFNNMLNTETSAKFYINNRDEFRTIFNGEYGFSLVLEKYVPVEVEEVIEEKTEIEIQVDQTVYPENYDNFDVKIETDDKKILLYARKNEEFRDIVKNLGYRWGKMRWYRIIRDHNGNIADRIAEVGNHLLSAGYSVQFDVDDYETIKDKAVKGEYEAEHGRWVLLSEDKKRFEIAWLGFDTDLYNKVKALPYAKYNSKTTRVEVEVKYFNDVEDMASLYGFSFTNEAEKALEILKEAEDEKYLVAEPKKKEYPDGLSEILQTSTDVLGDLKDE